MGRGRNILGFTLVSLFRRKGRNAVLFTVYALVVFMLASVLFLTRAMKREASIILQDAPEIVVQRSLAGRRDLIPQAYLDEITKIRGVSSARPRLWGYYYDPVSRANYTVVVPEQYRNGTGTAVMGQGIPATALGRRGSDIELRAFDGSAITLRVESPFPTVSRLAASDLILISEEDLRRLFGVPEEYATDLEVRVRNPREVATVAFKIAGMFPDTRIVLREEISRTYDNIFNWRGGMLVFILAGPVLAFLVFAWDRASGLSREEKSEIGVLKAIGWETADVLLMKTWEGLAVSLSAFLTGIIFAWVYLSFSDATLFQKALKGWSVLYPAFTPVPAIDAPQVVTLFFLTVVPYSMATIIPSWTAATIDPDMVMKA